MPESSSRSFPTVPTALSALTAQSMTPDAPLPHPPSLGAGALLRWLLRRAAVRLTFLMRARRRYRGLRRIIGKPCWGFGGQRLLDAGLIDALLKQIACAKPQPNRFLIQGKRLVQG